MMCTYNVRMNSIHTNLTSSGNSVAVRLPKQLLEMSGLRGAVKLEAKEGQIVISNADDIHAGWDVQIKSLCQAHGDPSGEFKDLYQTDDLGALPWDGPSFEQWQKSNEKLS